MKCPHCGETNPESYRFCGMCGRELSPLKSSAEPVRAAGSAASSGAQVRANVDPESRAPAQTSLPQPPAATRQAVRGLSVARGPATSSGAPSLLGLNQPAPGPNGADADTETAFPSTNFYLEPEPHAPAWRRALIFIVGVAALSAVAWWSYANWDRIAQTAKPAPAPGAIDATGNAAPSESSPGATSSNASSGAATSPQATASTPNSTQTTPSAKPEEGEPRTTEASPAPTAATKPTQNQEVDKTPARPAPAPVPKIAATATAPRPAPKPAVTKPAATPPPTPQSDADALFRKGEAYLYGRGVTEDCGQALVYLKAASAKSSAKARSAFGTMYATGHCVPRDLPSSYRWFALALQADPNNAILEKDLTAVWNQMTPPERQLATKAQ